MIQLLSVLLLFVGQVWAEARLSVDLDKGHVVVTTQGFSLPEALRKDLESKLLVQYRSKGLEKTHVELQGRAVEKVAQEFQAGRPSAQQELFALFHLPAEAESQASRPPPTSEKHTRFSFGGHQEVQGDAHVSVLIVFGGVVDVYGAVDKIIQFGGIVNVYAGAQVLEQIVTFNGQLNIEDRAEVTGFQIRFQNFFDVHIVDELKHQMRKSPWSGWFGNSYLYWLWTFLVWFFVAVFGATVQRLFPNYFARVQRNLFRSLIGNFFWSFFAIVILVVAGFLFLISLIGIPLIPLVLGLYYFCYWMAVVNLAAKIGSIVTVNRVGIAILVGLVVIHFATQWPAINLVYWFLIVASFGCVFREIRT